MSNILPKIELKRLMNQSLENYTYDELAYRLMNMEESTFAWEVFRGIPARDRLTWLEKNSYGLVKLKELLLEILDDNIIRTLTKKEVEQLDSFKTSD